MTPIAKKFRHEPHSQAGILREIILGSQDGLVNVLGLLLGVATATNEIRIILISGFAALFAESISMMAVAYTSSKAARDHYLSELEREKYEIETVPEIETEEIRQIYREMGFKGKELEQIVKKITSDKKLWLKVMMKDELGLSESEKINPEKDAAIVGFSTVIGSIIPVVPFFFFNAQQGVIASVMVSLFFLIAIGIVKGKLTTGHMLKSGLEMGAIGIVAAVAGYGIGLVLGATIH